jgi:DNA gyrase subunit A
MIAPVSEDNDVIMISSDGIIIRTPAGQISTFQRPSKGVKVMRVNEGEKVATLSVVDSFGDDEELDDVPEESAEAESTEE